MVYKIIFNSFTGIPISELSAEYYSIHYGSEFIEIINKQSEEVAIYPYTSIACIIKTKN